jgi:hypothetical protein
MKNNYYCVELFFLEFIHHLGVINTKLSGSWFYFRLRCKEDKSLICWALGRARL